MNARRSLEAAAEFGRRCGFHVSETDLRDVNGTVSISLYTANELIEVNFRVNPANGYLRFDRGYLHHDSGAVDRQRTWRDTREVIESVGGRMRGDST